ncbi:MAG: nucleotidyl transferase AbiEii/AbiGii toxin family protein [Gordonibacter sp.]|uniref:nucleotidyl transferase AbiEii/AbiGii toxin family protein n=1 Tax=Gordonibacter sp. TaxID=1968902 RepID=UPI002FC7A7F1
MNASFESMLQAYSTETPTDRKNAVKEIMQEIVLCGLSRAGFFDKAAFYGGTALRVFYGLDRFSEDLDFSLIAPDASFDLAAYFPTLENEIRSFGLNVSIETKVKANDSAVHSVFLKANTLEHLLLFYAPEDVIGGTEATEKIKIKFEVDTDPAQGATFERRYRLLPAPYEVNLYDQQSLFAGKIHAVLCRGWKKRVKGRDLYDYVFYLSRNTRVNTAHLSAKLVQTGHLASGTVLAVDEVRNLLCEKFDSLDFQNAKLDVAPFIHDTEALNLWSADFFKQISQELQG